MHLRGLVRSGSIGSALFSLPARFRPEGHELRPIATSSNTIGRVDINTSGAVVADAGNAVWISLDGIVFRAAQSRRPLTTTRPALPLGGGRPFAFSGTSA